MQFEPSFASWKSWMSWSVLSAHLRLKYSKSLGIQKIHIFKLKNIIYELQIHGYFD